MKAQDQVRADLQVAKRDDLFNTTDMFGGAITGNEFAGRWMAEQEAAALMAIVDRVPISPGSITYGNLWPGILAKHGIRKTRLGRMVAELRNDGRIKFLDWRARKQVPDDAYRVTRPPNPSA